MANPVIKLSLDPLVGIGPVKFGMSQTVARAEMLKLGIEFGSSQHGLDYFYDNAIQIEYTKAGLVCFIGISSHQNIVPVYYGQDVFSLTAKELFHLVAKNEARDTHRFNSNEYLFRDQIFTLWDADTQYDYRTHRKRQVWAQVGLGSPAYLALVDEIRGVI